MSEAGSNRKDSCGDCPEYSEHTASCKQSLMIPASETSAQPTVELDLIPSPTRPSGVRLEIRLSTHGDCETDEGFVDEMGPQGLTDLDGGNAEESRRGACARGVDDAAFSAQRELEEAERELEEAERRFEEQTRLLEEAQAVAARSWLRSELMPTLHTLECPAGEATEDSWQSEESALSSPPRTREQANEPTEQERQRVDAAKEETASPSVWAYLDADPGPCVRRLEAAKEKRAEAEAAEAKAVEEERRQLEAAEEERRLEVPLFKKTSRSTPSGERR